MDTVKNISFFVLIGAILNVVSMYLESSFLCNFLSDNLIIILLTLLAINTATTGLLSIKMAELSSRYPELDFTITYKEMKFSLKEQIVLIVISLLLLIIHSSQLVSFNYKDLVMGTLLTTVFIHALDILRDTGVSVFNLLELANDYEKNKE